jgi:hypothetical protein
MVVESMEEPESSEERIEELYRQPMLNAEPQVWGTCGITPCASIEALKQTTSTAGEAQANAASEQPMQNSMRAKVELGLLIFLWYATSVREIEG